MKTKRPRANHKNSSRIILLSFAGLLLFCMSGCNKRVAFEAYHSLKNAEWNQDTTLVFEMNIQDPKKLYDLSFTVRNEGNYSFSNLWLFVTITPPSGKDLKDTVELTLAEPSGKWLGSGLGDLYDRKYPYKMSIFFPEIGKYTLEVRHGMRTKSGILDGIHDFGVMLDKSH